MREVRAAARPFLEQWAQWQRALSYRYTFRAVVVGTCLLLAGLGWTLHIGWLPAAGMCIAAGQFVESTYYIMVLKVGRTHGSPGRAWPIPSRRYGEELLPGGLTVAEASAATTPLSFRAIYN